MVGVPSATDVRGLFGLLAHFGDQRIGRHGLEKSVHINLSPAPGKVNVLLGGKILIAEKDHTEIRKSVLNLFEYGSRKSVGDIHTMDLGTDRTTQRMELYVSIA